MLCVAIGWLICAAIMLEIVDRAPLIGDGEEL
jgi:hypothetical protein